MSLLFAAVRNNAQWCELVAQSHGIDSQRVAGTWCTNGTMPPLYPNVVSLKPGIQHDAVSSICKDLPNHCGWKDSFGDLKLPEFGFRLLFEANWYALTELHLRAENTDPASSVTSTAELDDWIAAWGETPSGKSIFLPELLGSKVNFIFRKSEGTINSGLIANIGDDAVGITNIFGHNKGITECIKHAYECAKGLPLVGYGSDAELLNLEELGFAGLGKLRVWVK